MELEHQVEDTEESFRHRLVPKGTKGESKSGPWVGYTKPAPFFTTKGTFVVTTEFYKDSAEFPKPGVIYWIREAPESI